MGSGVILRLDNLTRSFGSLKAIDDIQLEVAAGEALGIIGPNGAGKSTLFNLITGLQKPDAGTIHFDSRDITSAPPRARCIAGIGRSFQFRIPSKISPCSRISSSPPFTDDRNARQK